MNVTLKNKRLLLFIMTLALIAAALTLLPSCDGGGGSDGGAMAAKLSEITENSVLFGTWVSEESVSVYDAYLAYFRLYPERFDAFYKEKKEEIKNSELGKCGLYPPMLKFNATMPDGKVTEFSYDLITRKIRSNGSLWETYEYRYYDLEGIYTEPEGGALIIDGELNNVSGVAPESLVDSRFYVRLQPAAVTVRLDTDGGEWSSETEIGVRMGEDILPYLNERPEKVGYDFVGWRFTVGNKDAYPIAVRDFTAVENQSLRIMNEENFLIRNARDEQGYNIQYNGRYEGYYSTDLYVTMTAQYREKKHAVTYMDFDGSVFRTVEYDEGTVLTQYNTAILSAYTCKGWSLSREAVSVFDKVTVDGDITLYPVRAREKTVTIRFSNGVTATCKVYETYPLDLASILPDGEGIKNWYLDEAHTKPVEESVIPFDELADTYYAVIYPSAV